MGGSQSRDGLTLDTIAKGLSMGEYENVVVMCGAGISTSAGVPDFRSPSAGLYFKLRSIPDLPYPEAVFDGPFFRRNPRPFYELVRRIFPQRLVPTDTHKFFKLLDNMNVLRRVYTQNIDALESLAGLDEEKVVEAHGTFRVAYCCVCGAKYDLAWLKREIFRPESNDGVPKCEKCDDGVVRPDVVFFRESLPGRFWANVGPDFEACDLLIVMGTSLTVSPFNTLVYKPKANVPRLFINKTKPGSTGIVGWLMGLGRNRVDFDNPDDLLVLDDCDETVRKICRLAGRLEQLDSLPVKVLEP